MQVTDVRVRRVEKEGKMKAIVSITLDNEFVIHDIKVIEGEKGLFIAMPSRKAADGEYRDIAHPINGRGRNGIRYRRMNRSCFRLMHYEPGRLLFFAYACAIVELYFQMSDRHSLAPSGAVTAVSAIDSNCDTAIACLEGAG